MTKNSKKLLVTGSAGLIGSEAVRFFSQKGFQVYGIDNDIRAYFFGSEASTKWNLERLKQEVKGYYHYNLDIRDEKKIQNIFKTNKFDLIIHAAAQPSHDWSIKQPLTDFKVNALGTLILLENFRKYCPEAVFIFTSTSKVYGDNPNSLPFIEYPTRYDLPKNHPLYQGVNETMSLDQSIHSIFGASKVAADIMVQEFGRYFNLKTGIFRGGCLTGPVHSGAQLHGFLAYLVKCIATGRKYSIFGYQGKQVRDNIHSYDLVNAFYHFFEKPRIAQVYNLGGSRYANISIIEAVKKIETILGKKACLDYQKSPRKGDHIWYISNVAKFKKHYPKWHYHYDIDRIIEDICLFGHFASQTSGSSTLSFFENVDKKKLKIPAVFLAGHITKAFGPVQALRQYLSSQAKKLVHTEHLLAKTNNNLIYAFKDVYLNLKWFCSQPIKIKIFIGINSVNALSGLILKKLGFPLVLIYYSVDYSIKRFTNPLLNHLYHFLDYLCCQGANFVWSSSPEMIRLRKKQGITNKKNILVRSGIQQISLITKLKKRTQLQRNILIIDGFLSKKELVELAIKSLPYLKPKFPKLRLKIIVGNCPKNKFEVLAKKLHVLREIDFLEDIPHQKIFSNYQNYGLGLALFQINKQDPASYRDPVEIKEFIAAGLPILCNRGFTISKEVAKKNLGLVISNKLKDIVFGVDFLLSNPKKYYQISQNAYKHSSQLSWKQIFNSVLKK